MNCIMCTPESGGMYVCNSCTMAMREMLRKIALPRRGTEEEKIDIQDASVMILTRFNREQLGA